MSHLRRPVLIQRCDHLAGFVQEQSVRPHYLLPPHLYSTSYSQDRWERWQSGVALQVTRLQD